MTARFDRTLALVGFLTASMGFASTSLAGALLEGHVGGLPVSTSGGTILYENFNQSTTNIDGSLQLESGIRLSYDPNPGSGGIVTGNVSGKYAAPYISNSNGLPFGDSTVSGQDSTPYVSTGSFNDRVVLDLPGFMRFFGLLWGSVDTYNTIEFWDTTGSNPLAVFDGSDVTALASGDQGILGTLYVNINSDIAFNRVVLYSSSYSFEFDNVSFSTAPSQVPSEVSEPALIGLFGLGLAGLGFAAARRRKS